MGRLLLTSLLALIAALGVQLLLTGPAHAARLASCYGNERDGFLGKHTADGTIVTSSTIGIAHRSLSFHTWLWVKVGNHRPVRVRVMDRGPYVDGRVIDVTEGLSRAAGVGSCETWGIRTVRTWRAR